MDFTMDDPFDFDSFINWPDDLAPDDLAPPLDAAGGEDG